MTWYYNGEPLEEIPEGYVAFVYQITNLESGKKYIGKKIFTSTRKQKVKGKTRKKTVKKESNWKEYFGSNLGLLADLAQLGQDRFKREVLVLCKTKGTANYHEARLQMINNVLENDEWYNEWVFVKVHRTHIKS